MTFSKQGKQVVVLYISTLTGVVVGMLVSILNTRNLPPSEYGDVRYISNIIQLLSGIFLFGYFVTGSRLLAVAKSKEESAQIKGGLVVILASTVVLMMVCMVACGLIHHYVLHREYAWLFYTVVPVCGSTLLLNYMNTSAQGDNSIYSIAAARLLPSTLYLIVAYLIYTQFGASNWLMLLLQNGIAMLVLSVIIWHNKPSFKNLRQTFKALQKENRTYGLQVYYGSLANVSVQYIAGITLGMFATNNTNVGFYSLALTVTGPLAMLPNIVGTTYFKSFAHENSISRKVLTSTFLISTASLVGFVVLIYPIVNILYDKRYADVALFACVLSIGFTFHGLGDVFNRFLGAHGQGTYLRNGAFLSGAIALLGYTFGVYYLGIWGAVITKITSSLAYFFSMVAYYVCFTKTLSNESVSCV
ncbi:MAG: oligosaccharide flippase family protein [Prevotella sp.]|nr:oligosaccharide flippase family protein [Prevotella sp.]